MGSQTRIAAVAAEHKSNCIPVQKWRSRDSKAHFIIQPPSIGDAKGEGQEVCLGSKLIGNQEAPLPQQALATLKCDLHVARGMQDVCGEDNVMLAHRKALLLHIPLYVQELELSKAIPTKPKCNISK